MPEGSEGLSKTVTADRDGNVDFGEITFNRPDACCYTVTRGSEEHRSIREDDASYRVTIAALSSGEAEVVVQRIGEDGKSEGAKEDGIVYEDKYDAPPKTGDDTANAVLLGVFTLICLTALVLMLAARRKERQNEDIY
jgi:LPXTG-motif cell wall-anchored protein